MLDLADWWRSVAGSVAKSDWIYGQIKLEAWSWPWWPYQILHLCHWQKVMFRDLYKYAHWPTETLVPWSPDTQEGYHSFQWWKTGKKNSKKNLVFWPTFFFDQFHKTHSSHGHHGHNRSPGIQAGYLSFQWFKWAGEKNSKKPSVVTKFCLRSILSDTLVPGSPWSPLVTRHTGRLSQVSVVEMWWGKNL